MFSILGVQVATEVELAVGGEVVAARLVGETVGCPVGSVGPRVATTGEKVTPTVGRAVGTSLGVVDVGGTVLGGSVNGGAAALGDAVVVTGAAVRGAMVGLIVVGTSVGLPVTTPVGGWVGERVVGDSVGSAVVGAVVLG